MLNRGKPRRVGLLGVGWWSVIVAGAIEFAGACAERDRLTFPNQSDGSGPVTLIDQPGVIDTTVDAGPILFVNGRTIDSGGVDTVYFLVTGGSYGFPPLRPNPPRDTVQFGVPLPTSGGSGRTIELQVYGVDQQGNHGPSVSRRITIR
jgi:hypothetical protein